MKPLLKWPGGKTQLLNKIILPSEINVYYEPFLGGGSVAFHNEPVRAVFSDSNRELINVYKTIKTSPHSLIRHLKTHENTPEYYYKIRELDRTKEFSSLSDVFRASRFIYLNKTCFNGLYRVNRQGQFNASFGKYKNPNIVNENVILQLHTYFQENDISLLSVDFEECISRAQKGDFIYLDPPYDPLNETSRFTEYTENSFSRVDQVRLKRALDRTEAKFILSNSKTPFILDLYKDYNIETVEANRRINVDSSSRGRIEELLIRNF